MKVLRMSFPIVENDRRPCRILLDTFPASHGPYNAKSEIGRKSTKIRNVATSLADLAEHKSLHRKIPQTSRLVCPILNYIILKLTGAHGNLIGRISKYLNCSLPIVRISDGPLTAVNAQAAEKYCLRRRSSYRLYKPCCY